MKFDIPAIVRPLPLEDYAPEMEAVLSVWVNPPRAVVLEYTDIIKQISGALGETVDAAQADEAGKRLMAWLAVVWSAGEPDSQWTAADVTEFWERCKDTDPALWAWLVDKTVTMIVEHRTQAKKK